MEALRTRFIGVMADKGYSESRHYLLKQAEGRILLFPPQLKFFNSEEESRPELHGVSIRVFIHGFHDVLRAKIIRLKPG